MSFSIIGGENGNNNTFDTIRANTITSSSITSNVINSNSFLTLSPSSNFPENTVSKLSSFSNDLYGAWKWDGGVLAQNGKIYCVPASATCVLIIDPLNNQVDTTSIKINDNSIYKWSGGVLAPNGKIYCPPYNARSILVIDPETNTTTTIGYFSDYHMKWSGAVSPKW